MNYNVYTTTGRRVKLSCERPLTEAEIIEFIHKHNPNYTVSTYFETTVEPFDMNKAQQIELPDDNEPMSDVYQAAYKRQFGRDYDD